MFPNDDICNIKAAKDAAKTIFNRYKEPSQIKSNSEGLGEKQVSDLIKNAYKAINISYDPDKNDVSSFMSVFGVGKDGRIDLGKIQQMAVKYLCGDDSLNQPQNEILLTNSQENSKNTQPESNNQNFLAFENSPNTNKSSFLNNKSYLSPKAANRSGYQFVLKKQIEEQIEVKDQKDKSKFSSEEIILKAFEIFNLNKNPQTGGITTKEAHKVLNLTYQIMGKPDYAPTTDDVQIWMKLCDSKRNGVVDWANYQNFVKKLLERQNLKSNS